MSTFDGQPQPIRQGSGGALEDRAACPRSGPRRAPGTLERSGKVYGAYTFRSGGCRRGSTSGRRVPDVEGR